MGSTRNAIQRTAERLSPEADAWMLEEGPAGIDTAAPELIDLRTASDDERDLVQQFLVDFGYADSTGGAVWWSLTRKAMKEGLTRFFAEAESFDRLFRTSLPPDESVHSGSFRGLAGAEILNDPLRLKPSTLTKIRSLTGLDGTLSLKALPDEGEVSLRSRLLHYRLLLYGVVGSDLDPSQPWQTALEDRFEELNRLVAASETVFAGKPVALRKWIDVCGNIRKMAGMVNARYAETCLILKQSKDDDWLIADQRAANQNLRASYVWEPLREVSPEVKLWKKKNRTLHESRWNRFGIRFLQIALWYDGYYQGEIDGEWGDMSLDAFNEAGKAEGLYYLKRKKKPGGFKGPSGFRWTTIGEIEFVRQKNSLGNRYWIIQLKGFLSELLELDNTLDGERSLSVDSMLSEFDTSLKPVYDAQGKTEEDRWKDIITRSDSADAQKANEEGLSSTRRRRRYGGSGALRRAFRRIKAWFRKVTEKFKEFLDKLWQAIRGPFLTIIRFLKRSVLRSIQTARLAVKRFIHYVTGRPYVTYEPTDPSRVVITRFALDNDTLSLASPTAGEQLLTRHHTIIHEQNRALNATASFAIKVIKTVLAIVSGLS